MNKLKALNKTIKKFDSIIWQRQPQPSITPITSKLYSLDYNTTYEWIGTYKNKTAYFQMFIPAHFIYDGQSVPRWAWSITGMRPDGMARQPASHHDPNYWTKGGKTHPELGIKIWMDGRPVRLGRKAADQLYRASYISCCPKEERKARFGYWILRNCAMFHWGRVPKWAR